MCGFTGFIGSTNNDLVVMEQMTQLREVINFPIIYQNE